MNEHLKPVFQVLLPELEKAEIDYWVFGGISIAAYCGKFIRDNEDVDIFLRDADFKKAESILDSLCKKWNFELIYHPPKSNEKPKIDIKIGKHERFSVVPAYQGNNIVVLKYSDGNEEYSNQILKKVERNISGYRFFTPQDIFIKEMFINHIKTRPDKKKRGKIKNDAKAILSPEELSSLDWHLD
jgi:hypothetical protein